VVFSSITFLFYFLPAFLLLYATGIGRKFILLSFSLVFYAWGEPIYVLMMFGSIIANYGLGLLIERTRTAGRDRLVVGIGLVVNLLPLIFFKYSAFLATNLLSQNWQGSLLPILRDVPLPLGISFYTFHAMSYLIDVYRRDVPAERRFLDLAVYIAMFPQLVSGPIIRFKTIAEDLHHPAINLERTAQGIRLFMIGLGQKVLIANSVAASADAVFGLSPDRLSTIDAWIGISAYTIQIYYDFAGYSTMAIGLGLIIGFRFPPNFNYPYSAVSMTDFWRRWHMSLSFWFRDYVYIPLGGNRGSPPRTYFNLIVVFLLCGVWHGAAWTFVAWGLFHGAFLAAERAGLGRALLTVPPIIRRTYVILAVMTGWVLFRADSFSHAATFLHAMTGFGATYAAGIPASRLLHADVALALVVGICASGPWLAEFGSGLGRHVAIGPRRFASAVALLVLLLLSSMSIAGGAYNPFIYFRF